MKNYLIIILFVLLDQTTKFIFTNKHFGIINYTTNTGVAFSLLQGYNWLFILISIIVLILLVYYNKIKPSWPLLLVISGTLGNLIDRVFFSGVRDFIDFKIWPIFNLADSFSCIGVLFLIYFLYKERDSN